MLPPPIRGSIYTPSFDIVVLLLMTAAQLPLPVPSAATTSWLSAPPLPDTACGSARRHGPGWGGDQQEHTTATQRRLAYIHIFVSSLTLVLPSPGPACRLVLSFLSFGEKQQP